MARVGLLEDNARIAKLCATMLQFAGHSVTTYEHPRECLDALMLPTAKMNGKSQSYHSSLFSVSSALPIEVLILDLQLPEISGIEVLQLLQSHPQTRALPLIFCTASSPSEVACALRIAPHASVIEKPFKLQALASVVLKALNSSEV